MAKISSKGIEPNISLSILNFLNRAKNAEEIDSLGDMVVEDYDIGQLVAERILERRKKLGGFKDLSELSDIKGFGIDKFNDLVSVFVAGNLVPSKSVYEPLFRFASLRYHGTKLPATKSSKRKTNEKNITAESKGRRLSKTEFIELEKAHVASLASKDIQLINDLSKKLDNLAIQHNNSKQESQRSAIKGHNELIESNIKKYEKSLNKEEKKILDEKKQSENNLDIVYPSSLFPAFEFDYIAFASSEFLEDKLTPREFSFFKQNNLLNIDAIALKRGLNRIISEKRNTASFSNLKWKKKVAVGGTPVILKNRYSNGYVLSIDKQNKLLNLSLITAKVKSYFTKASISVDINGKTFKSNNIKLVDNNTRRLFLESSFNKLPELDTVQAFTFELVIELNSKEKIVIKETVSSHNDIWAGQYLPDTQSSESSRIKGGSTPIKDLNGIVKLGWADLMRVEQKLCCYLPGEVSHIENIMAREYKEKSTEYLERSENTIVEENETETIEKNDTTSTEKNDWNKEVSKTIEKSFNFGLGTAVSYSVGPWSMSINANMGIANSQSQASTNAESYSKEITQSASESIRVRSFEKRTTTLIKQFKEENKHGFDNRVGDQHVSGVFRWIDKIYKNRIVNYGKGMLYEFVVPKPSELYVETLSEDDVQLPPIIAPDAPGLKSWHELTRDNFMTYINEFNVTDYQLPMADTIELEFNTGPIGSPEFHPVDANKSNAERTFNIPAPYAGYYTLTEFLPTSYYKYEYNHPGPFYVTTAKFIAEIADVANLSDRKTLVNIPWDQMKDFGHKDGNMSYQNLSINASFKVFIEGRRVSEVNNFDLRYSLKLNSIVFEQWQQHTYDAIMAAYQVQLDAYNDALAAQQAGGGITNDSGASLYDANQYKNPGQYQEIINTELKRLCIELLLQDTGLDRCQEFYKTTNCNGSEDCDTPMLTNLDKLDEYSSMVKFLEQAFNWELFSYKLYEYFWGGKCDWADMLHNEDTPDNEFQKFLKSGMARVIVPVREGFEKVVAYYLVTGQPWFDGEPPVIDDPLYVSIVKELTTPTGTPVGEPWNTNVPSSLTLIQGDTVYLQNQGLPCCDDVNGGSSGISPSKNMLVAKEGGGE